MAVIYHYIKTTFMKRFMPIKQCLIGFIFLVATQFSFGQKTEIHLNAYTGLFSFRGNGASDVSSIIDNSYTPPYEFTTKPYGTKSAFSYALECQIQRVTKKKFIYGVGTRYEALTSKVAIDSIWQNGLVYRPLAAKGETNLKNTFVAFNPFIGYRLVYTNCSIDVFAGVDLAVCVKSEEHGNAEASDKTVVKVENDHTKPSIDWRPCVQIKTQVKKVGLLLGFAYGLTNYSTQKDLKAYSSFVRIGLSYQLK